MDLRFLVKYFYPRGMQLFYPAVIALLVAVYWGRDQLLYTLTSSSQETPTDFTAVLKQISSRLTENQAGGSLAVALFWALIGLLSISIIYESINIFITARNDYVIASTYTRADSFKHWLIQTAIIKSLLGSALLVIILFSFVVLIPFWQELITQPPEHFLAPISIIKELAGWFGLAFNIYLIWKLFLLFVPKFV